MSNVSLGSIKNNIVSAAHHAKAKAKGALNSVKKKLPARTSAPRSYNKVAKGQELVGNTRVDKGAERANVKVVRDALQSIAKGDRNFDHGPLRDLARDENFPTYLRKANARVTSSVRNDARRFLKDTAYAEALPKGDDTVSALFSVVHSAITGGSNARHQATQVVKQFADGEKISSGDFKKLLDASKLSNPNKPLEMAEKELTAALLADNFDVALKLAKMDPSELETELGLGNDESALLKAAARNAVPEKNLAFLLDRYQEAKSAGKVDNANGRMWDIVKYANEVKGSHALDWLHITVEKYAEQNDLDSDELFEATGTTLGAFLRSANSKSVDAQPSNPRVASLLSKLDLNSQERIDKFLKENPGKEGVTALWLDVGKELSTEDLFEVQDMSHDELRNMLGLPENHANSDELAKVIKDAVEAVIDN